MKQHQSCKQDYLGSRRGIHQLEEVQTWTNQTLQDLGQLAGRDKRIRYFIYLLTRRLRHLVDHGRRAFMRKELSRLQEMAAMFIEIRGERGLPETIDEYLDPSTESGTRSTTAAIVEIVRKSRPDLSESTIERYMKAAPRTAKGLQKELRPAPASSASCNRLKRGGHQHIDYRRHPAVPISDVMRWRSQGETFKEIGTRLGVSIDTVLRVFHSCFPNESLSHGGKRRLDYRRYPGVPASEVIRLKAEGKTFLEISMVFGVSKPIIQRIFHAMSPNTVLKRCFKRKVNYWNYPGVSAVDVVRMRDGGASFVDIANKLQVSPYKVRKVYHTVRPSTIRREVHQKRIDLLHHPKVKASEVLRLRKEGKIFAEIASVFGVSKPVVLRVYHAARTALNGGAAA